MNDVELFCQLAQNKCDMAKNDPMRFFTRAFMAGAYLGAAAILAYTLGALLQENIALSKIAVAGTFGVGLVAIVFLGAELFTGNCLVTIMPVLHKQMKLRELLKPWVLCYLGNIMGISLICFLFIQSGAQQPLLSSYLQPMMEAKLDFQIMDLLIKGILCNFIVCIAAYAGIKVKSETAKIVMIMLFVMTFVLPGFEHCIANAGIFTLGITQLGNTVNWSMLPMHMLISSIGNIIGGSLLLGIPIYVIFNPKLK